VTTPTFTEKNILFSRSQQCWITCLIFSV